MIRIILFSTAIIIQLSMAAQFSGNQVYRNRYSQNNTEPYNGIPKPIIINDSIMMVSAEVLLNAKADSFVITLGISQEAKTVKEANAVINKRVNAFKSSLRSIGINEHDIYIDFITQTKIYDYTVSGANATQFIKGFEIKKNIILKIDAASGFDRIIELASEQEIFDVVKVDYIVNNPQKLYVDMMTSAAAVIKQKKDVYLGLSPVELLPVSKISSEKFYAVYPSSQYKEYAAFESSDVTNDYSDARFVKKLERKAKTFYYDKIDQSTFDMVINNASPVVGVQYVLQVQVQFDIKRK